MTILVAVAVGLAIGAVLALLKLPVAAPPTLAGCLTVCGIAAGYYTTHKIAAQLGPLIWPIGSFKPRGQEVPPPPTLSTHLLLHKGCASSSPSKESRSRSKPTRLP